MSDGQACHSCGSFDNLWQCDQPSHNCNTSVDLHTHPDAFSYICYITATAQNFVELAYCHQTALVNLGSLAHSSFYLQPGIFHWVHLSCFDCWASLAETQIFFHHADSPLFGEDSVATPLFVHYPHSNSNFCQFSYRISVLSHAQQHQCTILDHPFLCLLVQLD